MLGHLTQFAASEATEAGGDIFSSLGINGQMLLFQAVAFVILVVLMGKFVFPILMRAVDERQEKIEAGQKAAQESIDKAAKSQEEISEMLKEARAEAKDIVNTAKDEAAAMVAEGETRAKQKAEKIVADAHEQLEKDVIAARKTLHNDTIELVALATEKIVSKSYAKETDKKVIDAALKEKA